MHTYSKTIPSMGWMMLDIPCFDHGRRRPPLVLKCQKMPVRRCLGTRRAEQTPALRLSCPKVAELPAQVLDKHLWMQALYMHHECMFIYNLYDIHVYKHMSIYIYTYMFMNISTSWTMYESLWVYESRHNTKLWVYKQLFAKQWQLVWVEEMLSVPKFCVDVG